MLVRSRLVRAAPVAAMKEAQGAARIPGLDLYIPSGVGTSSGLEAASSVPPPTLLRWNVRPRKGNTIVYCSRFLYRTVASTGAPTLALEEASTLMPPSNTSVEHHQRSWALDPRTRSVMRLKPHHIASILVALNGGVRTTTALPLPTHQRQSIMLPLDDEMFNVRVRGATTTTQTVTASRPSDAKVADASGFKDASGTLSLTQRRIEISGLVWRDGFVSCDHWGRGAQPPSTQQQSSDTLDNSATDDFADSGAFPYPLLVLSDASQVSALRVFLESCLEMSFGF